MKQSLSEQHSNARFVPPDNQEMASKYEEVGGTCGPSAIAVLERTTVEQVISKWRGVGPQAFRGFAPIREIKETLSALGYHFLYKKGHKAREWPKSMTNTAIVRIQWLKEDGTEYYWKAAGAHTHYVLMQRINGEWWVFCNDALWFKASDYSVGPQGYVSSYLELSHEPKVRQALPQFIGGGTE